MTAFRKFLAGEMQTITGAAILIGSSSLLSRVLGILRERLLVGEFGVGDALDAYYASFQAPNFFYNLLVLGTLSVAFIPVFAEWYEMRQGEAWRSAAAIFNLTALAMGALSLVLFFFAPFFVERVAPGFTGEKFELTVKLTRVMALSPFFFAVSSVFGSVLNARRRFFLVSLAPVLYNVAIIFGVIFLAPTFGIIGVAWAAVFGAFLHALTQAFGAFLVGFRFSPGLGIKHPAVRAIGKLFFPRIWGIDISQISLLVGSLIGSTLATGSVALFNIATNIQTVPVGVLGIPFAIAAFPVLARAHVLGERKEFLDVFSRTAREIVFLLLPLTAMTIVLRAHIVRLVIGTENLSWDDTRLAAAALAFFAASFFLQGLTPLLSRAFYALKNTVIPVLVSLVAVFAYVAVAEVLLRFFDTTGQAGESLRAFLRLRGVQDIRMLALPIAFSFASFVQAASLVIILRARYGGIDGRRIALSVAKTLLASAVALLASRLALFAASFLMNDRTFLGVLFQMGVATIVGLASFLGAAILLRSEEAGVFLSSFQRKLLRITKPLSVSEANDVR